MIMPLNENAKIYSYINTSKRAKMSMYKTGRLSSKLKMGMKPFKLFTQQGQRGGIEIDTHLERDLE